MKCLEKAMNRFAAGKRVGVVSLLTLFLIASCVSAPAPKKDGPPTEAGASQLPAPKEATAEKPVAKEGIAATGQTLGSVQAAGIASNPADKAGKVAETPKATPVAARTDDALSPPVPAMPPAPGERVERDILADADRRSEIIKPQVMAAIASVVPGPYPETKVKKEAPAPARDVAAAKTPAAKTTKTPAAKDAAPVASPSPQMPAVAPVIPKKSDIPEPRLRQVAQPAAEGVPDLVLVNKFTVAEGLPSNLISALYFDESDVWVGTAGGGVARYIFAENHWIVTSTASGLSSDFITDVIKYKGKVYVGTKQGVSVWDGFDWSVIAEVEGVQLGNISFAVKDSELWVASRNMRGGILSYDGVKWFDRSTMRQGIILNNVSDLAFDGNNIWLGTTSRGVYAKRGKEWTVFSVTDGIASNFIYTMAVREGKCYLGGCCGVSYYDGQNWIVYDVPEGLPHSTVNAIAWDASGLVWLGSKNGLAGFDGSTFRNFYVDDGLLTDNHVTALFVKGEDVWVGTVGGLSHLKKSQ